MMANLWLTSGLAATVPLEFLFFCAEGNLRGYLAELRRYSRGTLALWAVSFPAAAAIGFLVGTAALTTPLHVFLAYAAIARVVFSPNAWAAVVNAVEALAEKEGEVKTERVIAVCVIALALLGGGSWYYMRCVSFWNAQSLASYAHFGTGDIYIFPEIDPEQLRVTTSGIARSIAEMKKTSAASIVTSVHLGLYNGQLCWIATVSEPPVFGSLLIGSSNRLKEVIIVPVTDATGEEAKVIPLEAEYGEGLWFRKDIRVRAQDLYPTRTFSRAYLTWSPEHKKLVYVTTSYYQVPLGPLKDPMVHVWDPQTGDLLGSYQPWEAPDWVVQRWDEKWLETIGKAFGGFRWTAENELNFWNGIPYYSDRSAEPAEPEGLRYQMWPGGELVGVYLFQNKRNPSLLEFVIIARRDGVYLYSLDHLALISPSEAKAVAKSGLPALPGKGMEYATPLALLYRVGGELYYHVPVFVAQRGHYYPAYFALVRATDRRCFRFSVAETGGMLEAIKAAYAAARKTTPPARELWLNGTLVKKLSYVVRGNTRIWLQLELPNGTLAWALVKAEELPPGDMLVVLDAEPGDRLCLLVEEEEGVLVVRRALPG